MDNKVQEDQRKDTTRLLDVEHDGMRGWKTHPAVKDVHKRAAAVVVVVVDDDDDDDNDECKI